MSLKNSVMRGFGKIVLTCKDHAPELLMGVSILSSGAALIFTAKGTLKFQEVLERHNEDIESLNETVEKVKSGEISEEEYSLDNVKKDRGIIYGRTIWGAIKCYGPAACFELISIGTRVGSLGVMNTWYKALGGAYAATLTENRKLQEENLKLSGALANAAGVDKVNEIKEEAEKAFEEKEEPSKISDIQKKDGMYFKFFDESNINWDKDPEANLKFLQFKQNYCNYMLVNRGYVFLNEVLEGLGMEKTQAGQIMGWKYYKNPEDAIKNGAANHIDFGLMDGDDSASRRFANGLENVFLVKFNVDPSPIIRSIGMAKA